MMEVPMENGSIDKDKAGHGVCVAFNPVCP